MHAVPEPPTLEEMTQRGVISGMLNLTARLNSRPAVLHHVEVVAHLKPITDDELRAMLRSIDDYWDFDPATAILTRPMLATGERVRIEIDCTAIALADVLSALDDCKPAW